MRTKILRFTLIEMIIVVFVIVILIGIGSMAAGDLLKTTKHTAAYAEAELVESSVIQYYVEYGELPVSDTITITNEEVIDILVTNLFANGVENPYTVFDELNTGGHFKKVDIEKIRPYYKGELKYASSPFIRVAHAAGGEGYFVVTPASDIVGYQNELLHTVGSLNVKEDGEGNVYSGTLALNSGCGSLTIVQGEFSEAVAQMDREALECAGYTIIETAADLDNIRSNLEGKYALINNIDLSGYNSGNWTPIGFYDSGTDPDTSVAFKGVFNGNGYAISNLNISSSNEAVGLFGYTEGAQIFNIGLVSSVIENTRANHGKSGSLIGFAENETTVSNTYVKDGIVNSTNGSHTGGIVGYMGHSNLVYSYTENINVTGLTRTGGIVGYANVGDYIKQVYSSGTVTGNGSMTGGLIGELNGMDLINSYSIVNVEGVSHVGGLVGASNLSLAIQNNYAMGTVIGSTNVGGLLGLNQSSTISFISNFWNIDTSGVANGIGSGMGEMEVTGLLDAEMKEQSRFESNGWDFDNIWTMNIYPVLK